MLRDCTAALIPAHNDAYTLRYCLAALAGPAGATGHVDEVIVLDDCSTDETSEVVLDAKDKFESLTLRRHEANGADRAGQLGSVWARRELLWACTARHVFMLDADDVLDERAAASFSSIAAGGRPWVRLQLCELFGDLRHSTGRYRHYDPCHVYVDRHYAPSFTWHDADRPAGIPDGIRPTGSPGPLFFHLKDVKPDARIVERSFIRRWLRAQRAAGSIADFAGMDKMDSAEVHRRAVEFLLTSKIDHPVRTWDEGGEPLPRMKGAPHLPELLRAAPQRFYFVYEGDHLVDRIDSEALL